jgi:prolipoprotein diacylglyceryltransferase
MFSLNPFSLILAIGASFGLFRIALSSRPAQRPDWLLAGLLSLVGALIGARLGYCLLHIHYFLTHLIEIPQFWLGGFTWEGALAGGMLFLLIAKSIWKWSFLSLLDRVSLLLLPMGVAGWLACWLTGVAYGQTLPTGSWWGIQAVDETGIASLRSPVQPLAAISLLVFMGFTELLLYQTKTTGKKGILALLVFSADMLLFTFLRADPAQTWLGLRFETWAAMIYTLSGAATLILLLVPKRMRKDKHKSARKPFTDLFASIFTKKRKPHETEPGTGTN